MSTYRTSVTAVWVLLCAGGLSAAETSGAAAPASGVGEITGNNVYVRSGPSTNYYPVTKLNAGERVTIVGEENEWLAVVPPKGCFSLIDAAYVDRDRDNRGVVNGHRVNVRAGSNLGPKKYAIQLQLNKGADVQILGETDDGFLKIAPPEGAKLWVFGDYVERVPEALLKLEAETTETPAPAVSDSTVTATDAPSPPQTEPPTGTESKRQPTTERPVAPPAGRHGAGLTRTAAEREAEVKRLQEKLDEIEAQLKEEMTKPMFARDLAGLAERYRPLADQQTHDHIRLYAQTRVKQLDDLAETIAAVRKLRDMKSSIADDRKRFAAGRADIRTVPLRIDGGFDAQGELRESAIYNSPVGPRRYRLIDPKLDAPRTLCYVEIPRDSDIDIATYLGRIVGVRARAKYLKTSGVDPVPIVLAGEIVLLEQSERPALIEEAASGDQVTVTQADSDQ